MEAWPMVKKSKVRNKSVQTKRCKAKAPGPARWHAKHSAKIDEKAGG